MDNSGSSKEQVSCTYQKVDGYLALPAYLGTEGWMVNLHLLPGSQHPQKEFAFFIRETLGRVRQFCKKRLLLRIDSAHDALDNQFKTVMQELIYCAGRLICSGRRLRLRFSCHMQAHANVFAALYQRLAYG